MTQKVTAPVLVEAEFAENSIESEETPVEKPIEKDTVVVDEGVIDEDEAIIEKPLKADEKIASSTGETVSPLLIKSPRESPVLMATIDEVKEVESPPFFAPLDESNVNFEKVCNTRCSVTALLDTVSVKKPVKATKQCSDIKIPVSKTKPISEMMKPVIKMKPKMSASPPPIRAKEIQLDTSMPASGPASETMPASSPTPRGMASSSAMSNTLPAASPGFAVEKATPGFAEEKSSPGFAEEKATPGFAEEKSSPGFVEMKASPGSVETMIPNSASSGTTSMPGSSSATRYSLPPEMGSPGSDGTGFEFHRISSPPTFTLDKGEDSDEEDKKTIWERTKKYAEEDSMEEFPRRISKLYSTEKDSKSKEGESEITSVEPSTVPVEEPTTRLLTVSMMELKRLCGNVNSDRLSSTISNVYEDGECGDLANSILSPDCAPDTREIEDTPTRSRESDLFNQIQKLNSSLSLMSDGCSPSRNERAISKAEKIEKLNTELQSRCLDLSGENATFALKMEILESKIHKGDIEKQELKRKNEELMKELETKNRELDNVNKWWSLDRELAEIRKMPNEILPTSGEILPMSGEILPMKVVPEEDFRKVLKYMMEVNVQNADGPKRDLIIEEIWSPIVTKHLDLSENSRSLVEKMATALLKENERLFGTKSNAKKLDSETVTEKRKDIQQETPTFVAATNRNKEKSKDRLEITSDKDHECDKDHSSTSTSPNDRKSLFNGTKVIESALGVLKLGDFLLQPVDAPVTDMNVDILGVTAALTENSPETMKHTKSAISHLKHYTKELNDTDVNTDSPLGSPLTVVSPLPDVKIKNVAISQNQECSGGENQGKVVFLADEDLQEDHYKAYTQYEVEEKRIHTQSSLVEIANQDRTIGYNQVPSRSLSPEFPDISNSGYFNALGDFTASISAASISSASVGVSKYLGFSRNDTNDTNKKKSICELYDENFDPYHMFPTPPEFLPLEKHQRDNKQISKKSSCMMETMVETDHQVSQTTVLLENSSENPNYHDREFGKEGAIITGDGVSDILGVSSFMKNFRKVVGENVFFRSTKDPSITKVTIDNAEQLDEYDEDGRQDEKQVDDDQEYNDLQYNDGLDYEDQQHDYYSTEQYEQYGVEYEDQENPFGHSIERIKFRLTTGRGTSLQLATSVAFLDSFQPVVERTCENLSLYEDNENVVKVPIFLNFSRNLAQQLSTTLDLVIIECENARSNKDFQDAWSKGLVFKNKWTSNHLLAVEGQLRTFQNEMTGLESNPISPILLAAYFGHITYEDVVNGDIAIISVDTLSLSQSKRLSGVDILSANQNKRNSEVSLSISRETSGESLDQSQTAIPLSDHTRMNIIDAICCRKDLHSEGRTYHFQIKMTGKGKEIDKGNDRVAVFVFSQEVAKNPDDGISASAPQKDDTSSAGEFDSSSPRTMNRSFDQLKYKIDYVVIGEPQGIFNSNLDRLTKPSRLSAADKIRSQEKVIQRLEKDGFLRVFDLKNRSYTIDYDVEESGSKVEESKVVLLKSDDVTRSFKSDNVTRSFKSDDVTRSFKSNESESHVEFQILGNNQWVQEVKTRIDMQK